jgi:cellobiose transport system substrate-binding protein
MQTDSTRRARGRTRRRITTLLAMATVGSLALAACGGGAPAAAPTDDPNAPVELTVSLFGTFGYQESGLFDKYHQLNPNVTIKYESTQSEDTYWAQLQTRLTSGTGTSDVQGIEVARISQAVADQSDRWTDLRSTSAASSISTYLPWKEAAATTKDGAVLGLGTDIGPTGICYRSDLLAKAGLPTDPAQLAAAMPTWQAYLDLGRKYKAAVPAGSAWTDSAGGLYNAIISTQQNIYYDQSGKLIYDTNPAVKQAFDTAATAGASGLTAKLEQFVDPGWDSGFGAGTFATIACPSWMVGYIKGKAGDAGAGKWNVVPLPGGAGGNWGGSYLSIPTASRHKAAAAKLIAWLVAPEQQETVFAKVGNYPSTTDAITQVSSTTDPYFSNAPIGKIFGDAAKASPVQVLGPNDGVVKKALTQALLSVEANGVAPDAAWTAAANQVKQQAG